MFKPLDTEEVCYDNSIHYTDSLLGQVFTMLETRRHPSCIFQIMAWSMTRQKNMLIFMAE